MSKILELRNKRNTLWEQTKNFLEEHRDENGLVAAEFVDQYDRMANDVAALGKEIERLENQAEMDARLAQATSAPVTASPAMGNPVKKPASPTATEEYSKAFWNNMRGDTSFAVRDALSVGTDANGGYTVPDEFHRQLIKALEENNIFRTLAKTIRTNSGTRTIPVAGETGQAFWVEEGNAIAESDMTFSVQTLSAYKLASLIRVSNELLNDSAFDIGAHIAERFGVRFGNAEENAFIRVAAYARVSKDTEQLLHSLSAQVSYYSDLIQHTPGWAYAGVYVDAGLTGTNTTARPEFQRLIADCEAGKIDIVLTKSISRFARNTVDLLSTVRRLKALGIEVRFEREHINSLTADGELMLSILASFAQEESTSLSRNIKWTVQKKYAQGKVHGHHDTFGYKWVGEELVIEPEQAKIVQFVFDSYIGGMTYGQITKELNRKGIKSLTGKSFPMASIVRMLKNEQYTGCLILQQAYNYEPNKSKLNRGEMPMYRIDGHHPAIISEETFALAQKIREQRGEAAVVPSALKSIFSGRVWCGKCGGKAACHRSAESRRDGNANRTYWICNSRNNRRGCDCAIYKDKQLHEAAETLGIQPDQIERFTLFDTRIVITQTNGRMATWKQA